MFQDVLITGGTGKTGRRLAAQLELRGVSAHVASRTPSAGQVQFDWLDERTFAPALRDMQSVYLVAPNTADPLLAMRPFIDAALHSGMQRLVFLSASSIEEGGPMLGKVHQYLKENATATVVLRPTWFMQNFSEQQQRTTIVQEGVIYSATGDGEIPFVDADDIAAVAAEALTREYFPDDDLILTGPSLLTYTQVAAIVAHVAKYDVQHRRLTQEELVRRWASTGMPTAFAEFLASLDSNIANGSEARLTDNVAKITGHQPNSFKDFAESAQAAWSR